MVSPDFTESSVGKLVNKKVPIGFTEFAKASFKRSDQSLHDISALKEALTNAFSISTLWPPCLQIALASSKVYFAGAASGLFAAESVQILSATRLAKPSPEGHNST